MLCEVSWGYVMLQKVTQCYMKLPRLKKSAVTFEKLYVTYHNFT